MINLLMLLSASADLNAEQVCNRSLFSIYSSLLVYIYSSFNEIIAIYSMFILIDYVLGMVVAIKKKRFDGRKVLKGAIMKIVGFSVILVAMLLDYLILYLSDTYNIEFEMNYISVITAIFLIVSEGYSIMRNWKLLGVETPFYLQAVFGFLKKFKTINKK